MASALPSGFTSARSLLKVRAIALSKSSMVFLLVFLFVLPAQADETLLARYISSPKKVGEGTLSVMFWDAYKAELYAPAGQYQDGEPVALRLTYLMDFEGADIADRSASEMRAVGYKDEVELAGWHRQMEDLFPNVSEGQNITGIRISNDKALFLLGDALLGEIDSPGFGKAFFDIWLSEKTSEPDLREQLLSMKL